MNRLGGVCFLGVSPVFGDSAYDVSTTLGGNKTERLAIERPSFKWRRARTGVAVFGSTFYYCQSYSTMASTIASIVATEDLSITGTIVNGTKYCQ